MTKVHTHCSREADTGESQSAWGETKQEELSLRHLGGGETSLQVIHNDTIHHNDIAMITTYHHHHYYTYLHYDIVFSTCWASFHLSFFSSPLNIVVWYHRSDLNDETKRRREARTTDPGSTCVQRAAACKISMLLKKTFCKMKFCDRRTPKEQPVKERWVDQYVSCNEIRTC